MGAKTMMLVVSDGDAKTILASNPVLDRPATEKLLADYFPGVAFRYVREGTLSQTYPDKDEVYIGHFGSLTVVTSWEFGIDRPSQLDEHFLRIAGGRNAYLHTMHSVVDFFAYATWQGGKLIRSLSLAPDNGIIEEVGGRLAFEMPYWAGEHPADDPEELADPDYEPYPFPFHPLDLGEEALREFFGFQLEGYVDPSLLEPSSIPMLQFKRR